METDSVTSFLCCLCWHLLVSLGIVSTWNCLWLKVRRGLEGRLGSCDSPSAWRLAASVWAPGVEVSCQGWKESGRCVFLWCSCIEWIRHNLCYMGLMSLPTPGDMCFNSLNLSTSSFFFFLLISAERLADTSPPMMPCEPSATEGLAPKVHISQWPHVSQWINWSHIEKSFLL